MSISSKTKPVLLLFGPTGVGKTRFLIDHAADFGEVVTVDSIQVYQRLDIGSAKPSREEQAAIPHHLLDLVDPRQSFDVGAFLAHAEQLIPEIHSRGKVPLLCGGTAFYFWNFLYGLPLTPPADPDIRQRAETNLAEWGLEGLKAQVSQHDPVTASRLGAQDAYRWTRAWEVYLQTGKPLSAFERPQNPRTDYHLEVFSLERPKEDLLRRLDSRIDQMLNEGLLDEIRGLLQDGYTEKDPGLKAIGYAEFLPWLQEGKGSLEEAIQALRWHSRQYAKRQKTFFRRIKNARAINPDQPEPFLEVCRQLTS